jgi:hypothetical protein
MDGRVQEPVVEYLKKHFDVTYVDMITQPGPVRFFDDGIDDPILTSVLQNTDISIEIHNSNGIAICAHANCAGNPVQETLQKKQLEKAVTFLTKKYNTIPVIGLWIDADWQVHPYC